MMASMRREGTEGADAMEEQVMSMKQWMYKLKRLWAFAHIQKFEKCRSSEW